MEDPLSRIPIGGTYGAVVLGNHAAAVLYGITSLQTFIYFKNCHRDSSLLKLLIFLLWIVDTVHLVFLIHGLYYYGVTNFAKPDVLLGPPVWSFFTLVYVTSLSDLTVRGIFTRRIWLLSGKRNYYIYTILMPAITATASAFVFASKEFGLKSFLELSKLSTYLYLALAFGAVADLFIAISLVLLLLKSHTGFKRTDSIVNTMMVYAINTGVFTTFCRLACLISYAVLPDQFIFLAIYAVLPELSLNALLASLNARQSLREQSYGITTTIPLELQAHNHPSNATTLGDEHGADQRSGEIVVHVRKEVVETQEKDDIRYPRPV